ETAPFLMVAKGELSRMADFDPADGHEARRQQSGVLTEVQTISLNDLLAEAAAPARIDYLSVDTEGTEYEILSAFDFERWDVRAITVEHNGTAAREKIHDLLSAHGYRRQWPHLSRFDDWYRKDP